MLREFATYLKANSGYYRIMKQIRKKYESLGHLGGSIRLDQIKDEEREVLRSLFKKDYLQKSASFSVEKFIGAFAQTKYGGLDFEEVLNCYFGEKLRSKKDLKIQYEKEKDYYFCQVIAALEDSPGAAWLQGLLADRNNAYSILNMKYNENPEHLKNSLIQVCQGLNACVRAEKKVRLALFASQITKDPHAFDMNQDGGRLLLYALSAYYKQNYPTNAEEQMELLYHAGLIYDEVSNYTIGRGIEGYCGNKRHPGWAGFLDANEPLHISLWNLSMVDRLACVKKRIFVFENPTVFSEIAGILKERPASLLCSAGNVKVTTLLLLDKIVESGGQIYYSGDFDPEGLLIADKLKKRYGENLVLWRFSLEDYEKNQAKTKIPASRLKKMDGISSPELKEIAEKIKKLAYPAYQELMVDSYLRDINHFLNNQE